MQLIQQMVDACSEKWETELLSPTIVYLDVPKGSFTLTLANQTISVEPDHLQPPSDEIQDDVMATLLRVCKEHDHDVLLFHQGRGGLVATGTISNKVLAMIEEDRPHLLFDMGRWWHGEYLYGWNVASCSCQLYLSGLPVFTRTPNSPDRTFEAMIRKDNEAMKRAEDELMNQITKEAGEKIEENHVKVYGAEHSLYVKRMPRLSPPGMVYSLDVSETDRTSDPLTIHTWEDTVEELVETGTKRIEEYIRTRRLRKLL